MVGRGRSLRFHHIHGNKGPFECLAALDDRLGRLVHEFKLRVRILLLYMQSLLHFRHVWQEVDADFSALIMIPVPIVGKSVALELPFCVGFIIQLGYKIRIFLLHIFEFLTGVDAVFVVAFVGVAPVAEAVPAKLVAAALVLALHADAALVFLDRLLAFGTLLSVGF